MILSITEWRPVTGSIPPTTPEMWESEFSRYRQSPESQKLNPNMTMSEFQRIYWMEWIHRQWARIVGLTFLAPTAYFVARGKVSKKMAMNLAGINVLIASQGAVGWWMVKSGLKDELFAKDAHPRVSQYRLATHLGLAVTTFTAMLWNGLTVLTERRLLINTPASKALDHFNTLRLSKALRPFRVSLLSVLTLTFITAGSGAIVAGLDAGLIYNEFPYMGKGLHPPPEELWNPFYSRYPEPPRPDLVWRNMAENPSLAQLDHRILATGTFFAIHALYFYARRSSAVKRLLSAGTRKALGTTLILIYVQAALGLGTLLYLVPKSLASAHQAGALALLTSGTVAASGVWMPGRIGAVLRRRIAGAGVKVERAKAGLGSSASSTGSGAKGGDTVGGTGVVNGDGVDAARRFTYQPPRQTSVLSARRSKEQKGPERVRHALKA
ncbi:MAG: Cytochrome c oxidase assembly protein cox15 [Alyxoria varia]|nr:MAG: Cytochrome c oxidase assembly protein cox15 [Alyxoria varia]